MPEAEAEGGGASTGTDRDTARPNSSSRETEAESTPEPGRNPPDTGPTPAPTPRPADRNTSSTVEEQAHLDPPRVVEPVRVGGAVPQPRKTWYVAPEYPRMARLRRTQGIVILQVTVDGQGAVSAVSVLRSVEGLDEAAIEAVRRWRYEPTIVDGMPVSATFTESVRFQIEN